MFYIKMEKNKLNRIDLNKMNMVQLRSLAKENNLKGYSRLRKNDLINFINAGIFESTINKNEVKDETISHNKELTKNHRKRMSQKASKLSKKSKNLRIDINLKSQKDDLEEKIKKVSSTMNARFKGKKLRSMKREACRLNEVIKERTKELEKIESNPKIQTMLKTSQQSKKTKRIKKKIEI